MTLEAFQDMQRREAIARKFRDFAEATDVISQVFADNPCIAAPGRVWYNGFVRADDTNIPTPQQSSSERAAQKGILSSRRMGSPKGGDFP